MNRIELERKVRALDLLLSGNSIATVCRGAELSLNAANKMLLDIGGACSDYQHSTFTNLACKHVELHESWSFKRNSPEGGVAHAWTWIAVCAHTKSVLSWFIGPRYNNCLELFLFELAGRLTDRVQLSQGGSRIYLDAVEAMFGVAADSAHIVKYRRNQTQTARDLHDPQAFGGLVGGADSVAGYVARRFGPKRVSPQPSNISSFDKRLRDLERALALHCMFHNFVRVQEHVRATPAMAIGATDHRWSLEEIAELAS